MHAPTWSVIAILTSSACTFDDPGYRCDDGASCPSGLVCNDEGACVAELADPPYAPQSVCGGPSMVNDTFESEPGWATKVESGGTLTTESGRARIVLEATAADARVAYTSTSTFGIGGNSIDFPQGDALEVRVTELTGAGAVGIALRAGEDAIELTASETHVRCDRIAANVARTEIPREVGTEVWLRISAHDQRYWCEARGRDGAWRHVKPTGVNPLPIRYATLEVIGRGPAGATATTSASVDDLNLDRTPTGWCPPGRTGFVFGDDFSRPLASAWNIDAPGCTASTMEGLATIRASGGGTFDCSATHRHPLDLSGGGRVGFELTKLVGAGPGYVAIGSATTYLSIAITASKLTYQRCASATCTTLAEIDRTPAMKVVGFGMLGDQGVAALWATSAGEAWTQFGSAMRPAVPWEAAVVRIGLRGLDVAGASEITFDRVLTTP